MAAPMTDAVARVSAAPSAQEPAPPAMETRALNASFGSTHAVRDVTLTFPANEVTAIIGPSGCGKSTLLRCLNRMHEEIPGARAEGKVSLDDLDVYDESIDVVAVRRVV